MDPTYTVDFEKGLKENAYNNVHMKKILSLSLVYVPCLVISRAEYFAHIIDAATYSAFSG